MMSVAISEASPVNGPSEQLCLVPRADQLGQGCVQVHGASLQLQRTGTFVESIMYRGQPEWRLAVEPVQLSFHRNPRRLNTHLLSIFKQIGLALGRYL